jgi:hypothetical protein
MPTLSSKHLARTPEDRKPRAAMSNQGRNQPRKEKEFKRVEGIINQIYVDICNGVSRTDIYDKVINGLYEGIKFYKGRTEMSRETAALYYKYAMERLGTDREKDENALRDMLYSRYETLLQDAIKKGDMYNARGILDSIAKIFLPNRPETAIQINSDKEGGVTVNFGFEKKDED